MTVAIISGFAVTFTVYIVTIIQGKQYRMSGNLMYDLFMGAALNPRLGRVDLKMFAEVRVPWVRSRRIISGNIIQLKEREKRYLCDTFFVIFLGYAFLYFCFCCY
jgi:hypothetical protein